MDCTAHALHSERPHAAVQPADTSTLQKTKDALRSLLPRPSTGRTTALGRRVEKPGNGKQAGPSGQKDLGFCDSVHANK